MTESRKEHNQNLLLSANLEEEIDKLRDTLPNGRDRNLRILADFKSYRRRIERDRNKHAEEGKCGIIVPLLDIIRNI